MSRSARIGSATQSTRSSIVDVARLAGVSVATVSRALRGLPNVSEATRTRVLHAASELAYTASPLAAALVTGRTRSVGVLAPATGPWFFAEAVGGLERGLREFGYDVVLHVVPPGVRREQFFETLPVRRRVDALALLGLRITDPELAALRTLQVPLVGVSEVSVGVHSECVDEESAASLAIRHLTGLGHLRIAIITGDDGPSSVVGPGRRFRAAGSSDEDTLATVVGPGRRFRAAGSSDEDTLATVVGPGRRFRGACQALQDAGLSPVGVENGGFTSRGGAAALTRLLPHRPTAVFCESDDMAFGAMQALRQAGLRCPQDVSVVGFDDSDLAETFDLTSVAQPVAEQGEAAARWLGAALDSDDHPAHQDALHPAVLVTRGSTAAL